MSWIDKLSETGKQRSKRKPNRTHVSGPPPKVEEFHISVRPSDERGDPGEIAEGYFIVQDGVISLTDAKGKPIEGSSEVLIQHVDPRQVAGRMLRKRRAETGSDFNRKLTYQPRGLA